METGVITGVPTSPKGPRISHLLFAYDSLLFYKADSVEWRRIMRILEVCENGSGQKLNLQKTLILFSRNTCEARRQEILSLSGFSEVQQIDKYLGLPSLIGRSKIHSFNSIKDRVQQRLNNWKTKFLSRAGK